MKVEVALAGDEAHIAPDEGVDLGRLELLRARASVSAIRALKRRKSSQGASVVSGEKAPRRTPFDGPQGVHRRLT